VIWGSVAWAVEWSWLPVIAAIVLLDGLRAVPPGAQVVRRVLNLPWRPYVDTGAERSVRLLSWCPPLTMAVIVSGERDGDATNATPLPDEKLLARRCSLLRIAGGIALVALVAGVPVAVGSFGSFGLGAAVALLILVDAIVALLAASALRALGLARREAWRAALPIFSPFAATRAAEIVLQRVLNDRPPLTVMRFVTNHSEFADWVRPRAYDLRRGGAADPELAAALAVEDLDAVLALPPKSATSGEQYCPRCATSYQSWASACTSCAVPLARA
jgi:hypothetical protein